MPAPVWVILPTYNEAENLEAVVSAALAALPDARVLVVDDGSPDGTGAIADALAAESEAVEVLHRPRKAGNQSAWRFAANPLSTKTPARACESPPPRTRSLRLSSFFPPQRPR